MVLFSFTKAINESSCDDVGAVHYYTPGCIVHVCLMRGRLTLPVNVILNGTHGAQYTITRVLLSKLYSFMRRGQLMACLSFCTLYPSKL